MGKTKSFFNWLKTKQVTSGFALLALVGGFLFLNQSITGNAILNNKYPINLASLVGLLLVFCSAILAVYTIRHK